MTMALDGDGDDLPEELEEGRAMLAIVAGLVPATAAEVGAALGKLCKLLDRLTREMIDADAEATERANEYGHAYDRAYLEVFDPKNPERRLPIAEREAMARLLTHDKYMAHEAAKLTVRRWKYVHKTLDRRIDVGRTVAATVRSEHRNIQWMEGS